MNYNEKAEEIFNSLTNRKKFVDKMPSNISQGESGVLLYLLNNDSVSQSELSEKLNITMPRVAAIINTLQDKMLVILATLNEEAYRGMFTNNLIVANSKRIVAKV